MEIRGNQYQQSSQPIEQTPCQQKPQRSKQHSGPIPFIGRLRGERLQASGTCDSSLVLHNALAAEVSFALKASRRCFSLGMLKVGKGRGVDLVAGDALRLPFADASFDAVTISFGLRNTAEVQVALRELRRVTKPGGRLVVCEFSHPTWSPFRTVYVNYLMRLLPAVATKVSSDPAAYVYLAESIRAWPDQAGLATQLQAAGWGRVGWRNLTGGIVALHRGTNPR